MDRYQNMLNLLCHPSKLLKAKFDCAVLIIACVAIWIYFIITIEYDSFCAGMFVTTLAAIKLINLRKMMIFSNHIKEIGYED